MTVSNLGKAAENKRKKKLALLNSALELFTEKGLGDTTIADIASKAGVAKGTFYLYFKDKFDLHDRLVCTCAHQLLVKSLDNCQLDSDDTVENKVVAICSSIIDCLAENRRLTSFIRNNLSWGLLVKEAEEINAGGISFAEAVRLTFENSAVQYHDVPIMLYFILELTGSICYSSILREKPLPIDEIRPHLESSIRAIIQSYEVKE